MTFNQEIEAFITDFVRDLTERNVAIFAGAGMSKSAGYVDWSELMKDIAHELRLSVDKEHDLISVAQYHVNEHGGGRTKLNRKILEEFSLEAEPTLNHEVVSSLPITTIWTTNYDTLLEDALKRHGKVPDVKHQVRQLATTRPKRDVVVYKMHGDVHHPADAVLTKQDYEGYYKTHENFITALNGDLISKTFLFIGFSFTDPNLNYVLSRLSIGGDIRQHYCFIKKYSAVPGEDIEVTKYKIRKQELIINDLRRYHIKVLLVDEYTDITKVLLAIAQRYRKRTIFISGSAEEYGDWTREDALSLLHKLSRSLVQGGYNIVTGFGWGVGSAVINGALEAIHGRPGKHSEDQLIMRPFPQFETGSQKLKELWEDYRQRMISISGIAIIVFGNKPGEDGQIVKAGGVLREFRISRERGLLPIPIGCTGYVALDVYDEISKSFDEVYSDCLWVIPIVKTLSSGRVPTDEIVNLILEIVNRLNK